MYSVMSCSISDIEIENMLLEKCYTLYPHYKIFRENSNWNEEIFQIVDWIRNQVESIEFEEDEEPDNFVEDVCEDALENIDEIFELENQSAIMSPENHYNKYIQLTIELNFWTYMNCCFSKELEIISNILDEKFTYCISKVIKEFVLHNLNEKYIELKNEGDVENEFYELSTEYWNQREEMIGYPLLDMKLPHEYINPLMIEL